MRLPLAALLLASAAAALAQTPDPSAVAARAFLTGDALSDKLPAPARTGLSPELLSAVAAAENVQNGRGGLDDAAYSKKVLEAADALGIKDETQRKTVLALYTGRRAGAAVGGRALSAEQERAALERAHAADLKAARVGRGSLGAARELDGTAVGGPGAAARGAAAVPAVAPAAPPTAAGSSLAAARIASLQGQAGVQRPASFTLRPAFVPDPNAAVPAAAGTAATAPSRPEPGADPKIPSKAAASLLDADKFPAYGMQRPGKPESTDDIARIERTFNATIARLVREGKRKEGAGSVDGVINNIEGMYGGKKERCYDQAEELLDDLAKEFHANGGPRFVEPSGRWLFKMTTYTGEGHEANGHYWVTAISREPGDPTLVLDPWLGKIKRTDEKNPIAIKPFMPWAMGAAMSKILD